MTKISNLYSLTNYITANSSGNVTIAAPTSGFTLSVTGNFRATAGYFTGGIVSIDNLSSTLIINRTATTSGGAAVGFATDSIYQWVLGLKSDVNENLYLYNPTGIDYVIFNATTGGATFNYPLAGTSATFSSSVSATTATLSGSASDRLIMTRTGIGTYHLAISGDDRFSIYDPSADAERISITSTGNVGIGTTSPSYKLSVNGVGSFAGSGTVTGTVFIQAGHQWSLNADQSGGGSPAFSGSGFYIRNENTSTIALGINTGGTVVFKGGNLDDVNATAIRVDNRKYLSFYNAANNGWAFSLASGASNDGILLANNNMIFGTGPSATERMRIRADGNVGIGTTGSSSIRLIVSGQDGGGSNYSFVAADNLGNTRFGVKNDGYTTIQRDSCGGYVAEITNINSGDCGGSGVLILTGGRFNSSFDTTSKYLSFRRGDGTEIGAVRRNGASNVSYDTSSDYRLKEDLKEFNGLDKLSQLKVYDFQWKDTPERMTGVLAHELQEVIPYAVGGEKDGVDENGKIIIQGVDYSKLVPILIKSIQELKAELDTANSRLQLLENK